MLGFSIPTETRQLIRQAASLLPEESAERLRDELFRILSQPGSDTSLRILDVFGTLEYILPEVCSLKNIEQSPPHIMDAWEHTLDFLKQLETVLNVLAPEFHPDKVDNLTMGTLALFLGRFRNPLKEHLSTALNPERPHRGLLIFAGLYHDVGKPKARTMGEEGKIRFINHEQIGGKIVEKRGKAMKFSNLEIERLVTIVNHHMRPSLLSHTHELPSRKAIFRFFRDTGAAGVDICLLSLADILATYGPTLPQERWTRHLEVVQMLLKAWWEDRSEIIYPQLLINGDELMKEISISPGPQVGYLLDAILEAQVSGEIHTRQEALNLAKKHSLEN